MFGVWQGDMASFHAATGAWLSQAPQPISVAVQWATQGDVERLWGGPSNPDPNPTRVYVVSALATGISAPMLDVIAQCAIPMVPGTTIGCGMGEEAAGGRHRVACCTPTQCPVAHSLQTSST